MRAEPLAEGEPAELARIATVHGAVLSDQARYGDSLVQLRLAADLARQAGERRQTLYAESMTGRVLLLTGDHGAAEPLLERTVTQARQSWTAFLPWPQALAAELQLQRGCTDEAAAQFEEAFALGCHLGDPCWEGLAGRGLGLVAATRGEPERARTLLLDAIRRCMRFPDTYLWARVHALESLCGLAVAQAWPEAHAWVDELLVLSQRSGMQELAARAHLHSGHLGRRAALAVAAELARGIDNPSLARFVDTAWAEFTQGPGASPTPD